MTSEYLKSIQKDLTPVQRLNQIVEHSMCIGCGICQSIAGPQQIKMATVATGDYRPIANTELTHDLMDRIMQVCPGTRVEGMPADEISESGMTDSVWGVWREFCYAWAAEPEVRYMAATGGVLTGLALYLVESGEVDFIVHACEPQDRPTFGERFVSRTRDDVLKGSGSRYGTTATLIDIVEIIDQAEKHNETFAFVGTPCDVSALRNHQRQDSRVTRHCRYMLTMVCGGFMQAEDSRTALKKFDVDYDEVVSLRYRGYGCPGPTTIKTRHGHVVQLNYLDYWGEDTSTWSIHPRCKICPDGIGDSADVAAADTWDGGAPQWQGQDDDPGFNAVLLRTQRGVDLVSRAVQAGYICTGDSMTPEDMNRVQPHQENRKRSAWARLQGLRAAGQIVPETRGLRLEMLNAENPPAVNKAQQEGTEQRVSQGKFSESTPVKI